MKMCDVPDLELRRILAATERAVGPNAAEVRAMRRELARRETAGDAPTKGGHTREAMQLLHAATAAELGVRDDR
jgi:hypothetical protein